MRNDDEYQPNWVLVWPSYRFENRPSNNLTVAGPHGCDPSNYNSYKIFYSVAFFGLTSALLALIAKAMKRLYHQVSSYWWLSGLTIFKRVYLGIPFRFLSTSPLLWQAACVFSIVLCRWHNLSKMTSCGLTMGTTQPWSLSTTTKRSGSTEVWSFGSRVRFLQVILFLRPLAAPIAIILSGFFVLVVFWIDMWRVSQNFGRSMGFSTYFLYSTPLSLVRATSYPTS